MLLRRGIFVLFLSGLALAAADDSETERNISELVVETLVSSAKFLPFFSDLCR